VAYWVLGAAVSIMGAIVAKGIADQVSFAQRAPFWVGGTAIIFVGLWIVCLGTKSRLQEDDEPTSDSDERNEP
jgi:hypothetical protein